MREVAYPSVTRRRALHTVFRADRGGSCCAPIAAVALTTDSSVLTGIGKDYGEPVFERQVLGVGPRRCVQGDLDLRAVNQHPCCYGGRSPHGVLGGGVYRPRRRRDGAAQRSLFFVPVDTTPVTQQICITAGHVGGGLAEHRVFLRAEIQDIRSAAE